MDDLTRLRVLDVKIEQKIGELNSLREKTVAIGAMDYARDRVQVSPTAGGPYVDLVGRMVDLDAEISEDVERLVNERHDLINEIQKLSDPRYMELLYKRYVEYKAFEVIADEMGYAHDYIRNLHGEAVKSFESSHKMLHGDML